MLLSKVDLPLHSNSYSILKYYSTLFYDTSRLVYMSFFEFARFRLVPRPFNLPCSSNKSNTSQHTICATATGYALPLRQTSTIISVYEPCTPHRIDPVCSINSIWCSLLHTAALTLQAALPQQPPRSGCACVVSIVVRCRARSSATTNFQRLRRKKAANIARHTHTHKYKHTYIY